MLWRREKYDLVFNYATKKKKDISGGIPKLKVKATESDLWLAAFSFLNNS